MAADQLIDTQLEEVVGSLRLRGRYRDRVVAELRSHVEEAADELEAGGATHEEAVGLAIRRLGDPADLARQFAPRPTQLTRLSGLLFGIGVVLTPVVSWLQNELHERDGRLGRSVPYTLAWFGGWLVAALLVSPIAGFVMRHAGRLGAAGVGALAILGAAASAGLLAHWTSDGTVAGNASAWRLAFVGLIALAVAPMAYLTFTRRLIARWPVAVTAVGVALLIVHYVQPDDPSPLGLAPYGVALIAVGVAGLAVSLLRERPLA